MGFSQLTIRNVQKDTTRDETDEKLTISLVCDTYSNAKCEVPNNARLRFLVTLKVFSDTFCIVKCAMF